jgi:hypothetical protein
LLCFREHEYALQTARGPTVTKTGFAIAALWVVGCAADVVQEDKPIERDVAADTEALQSGAWTGNNTDQQYVVGDSWTKAALMGYMLLYPGHQSLTGDCVTGCGFYDRANRFSWFVTADLDYTDGEYTFVRLLRQPIGNRDPNALQRIAQIIYPNNQKTVTSDGGSACISQTGEPGQCQLIETLGVSGMTLTGFQIPDPI